VAEHAFGMTAWTKDVMTRLGLTINEAKTSLKNASEERFDFLGYTFGPHRRRKDGWCYLGASPSRKSVQRVKDKVGDLLQPHHVEPWPEMRDRLNRLLRGWSGYFHHGARLAAYTAIDRHVHDRVRHFLARRHKLPGRGTRHYSRAEVFGKLGVVRLTVRQRRGP
jgi:RNA-directed DNA polymerase